MKSLLLAVILFTMTADAQLDKPSVIQYYNIIQKDTLFYILTNERLLELSSSGNNLFYFIDEIEGVFSASTRFAVNDNQLIIATAGSLDVYGKNTSDKWEYMYTQEFPGSITTADSWDSNFIITVGYNLKIIECRQNFVHILDDSVAENSGYQISFPFLVNGRYIYKYVPGFGMFLTYYLSLETDPGLVFWRVHHNKLIYRTYRSNPYGPPSPNHLKTKLLVEPDFLNSFTSWWGDYFTQSCVLLSASTKYLILQSGDVRRVYNYNGTNIYQLSYLDKCFPTDTYLFRKDSTLMITPASQLPFTFYPFEYIITDISDPSVSESFEVFQNYPNPFNSRTQISFSVPERSRCKISVYDILGNKVAELLDEVKNTGSHTVYFNASGLSSGVYLCSVSLISDRNNYLIVRKMIYQK